MIEILDEELVPGLVVAGRYELERVVGRGGMAVVWAARHVLTGKVFALKFLSTERASDPRNHERLFREAKAACAVKHPNVAEVLDVLELDNGVPFLVMDLLEGETLASRLARARAEGARLGAAEIRALLLPVVDALKAAHAVGVVHRDLKPENVFLVRGVGAAGADPVVKVVDFGIAKLGPSLSESVLTTQTGDLVGTPVYMAPEQVFGEADVDGRADVWALGILLYEALAGTPPTAAATLGQVLKAITRDPIAPLAIAAPEAPKDLVELTHRMLSQSREARPTLEEIGEALASPAAPPTEPALVVAEPSATGRSPAPAGRSAILVGLGAVALPLTIGAYFAFRSAPSPSMPPVATPTAVAPSVTPPALPSTPATAASPPFASLPVPTPSVAHATRVAASAPPLPSTLPTPPPPPSPTPPTPRGTPSSTVVLPVVPPAVAPTARDAGVVLTHDRK